MRMAIAQLDPTLGDFEGNLEKMLDAAISAAKADADFLVFSPYPLIGAPLKGLARYPHFYEQSSNYLQEFADKTPILSLVASLAPVEKHFVLDARDMGQEITEQAEALYEPALFMVQSGTATPVHIPILKEERSCPALQVADAKLAIALDDHFMPSAALGGFDVLVELTCDGYGCEEAANAAWGTLDRRLSPLAKAQGCAVISANLVGAQDKVVFSGNSLAIHPTGRLLYACPIDAQDLFIFDTVNNEAFACSEYHGCASEQKSQADSISSVSNHDVDLDPDEILWRGMVTSIRAYFEKNGFGDALLGLSGGIDSSVVAAAAVDALGPEHVHGLLMPGPYSSKGSIADAKELADNLGIGTDMVPIDKPVSALHEALGEVCGGNVEGVAAENLQARIRAVYLMTVSNARGWLVLNTGNKSEAAMGFSTLGGDTCGVFAPLGELYKKDVYSLARWRMKKSLSIPQACIDKAPSAELYLGAKDADRLPPYDVLDGILYGHIEEGKGAARMTYQGFDPATVKAVFDAVQASEFKRRLEPMAPHLTTVSMSDDRDWPVTCAYKASDS